MLRPSFRRPARPLLARQRPCGPADSRKRSSKQECSLGSLIPTAPCRNSTIAPSLLRTPQQRRSPGRACSCPNNTFPRRSCRRRARNERGANECKAALQPLPCSVALTKTYPGHHCETARFPLAPRRRQRATLARKGKKRGHRATPHSSSALRPNNVGLRHLPPWRLAPARFRSCAPMHDSSRHLENAQPSP
jgi:hypothetical protein